MIYSPIPEKVSTEGRLAESSKNTYELDINELRLDTYPHRQAALPEIIKAVEADLVSPERDSNLIRELIDYLQEARTKLDTLLAIPNKPPHISPELLATHPEPHSDLVRLRDDNINRAFVVIDTQELIRLKQIASIAKDMLDDIEERIFIIDREKYIRALYLISQKVVFDILNGEVIAINIAIDHSIEVTSPGYISYLIYQLIYQQLLELKEKSPQMNIEKLMPSISPKPNPRATRVYVFDDFVLSGTKMRNYYNRARRIYSSNIPVYNFVIAKRAVRKNDDGSEILSIYNFESNDLFTSTTSDCDYSFTDDSDILDLVRNLDAVLFNIGVEFLDEKYNSKHIEVLLNMLSDLPRLMDSREADILKPYKNNPTKSKLNTFYKSHNLDSEN